ncbi:exodeoxyribonuclease III [Aureibacter tunicatorum]|uniref:Exodeoxyribonuclease-3 n=1 Tax=Aureibacter tunicatorum TaxID=866807 RepID=A0AAE3XGX6_9BACT|nr:exodeoxyribonuclease III [Aureibacter tunicatorum]MDR6237411.1 exodeoxyribonuclease-3 [Aureibacter tunicatorum]BDD06401.1 exodeoxyribonuclease [Aureibacter tunicatorum]
MKIISYNVNGIRAAIKKGFEEWLKEENPDVICLQETKAHPAQVDELIIQSMGYQTYWHSAQKKGYSGVAVFTKHEPKHVEYGCGIEKYDNEGRVIRIDFDEFSIMNVYMPSGSSGDERQAFKMQWLSDFQQYVDELKKEIPNLIICGDYNICHTEIDIHNPKQNQKTSGFLPEEREWVTQFIESGFVDSFRIFHEDEPDNYSWWSYRARSRERNKGWRIDYLMITESIKDLAVSGEILPEAKHSDHCPILLEMKK